MLPKIMKPFEYLISYFYPVIVERTSSKYNPVLDVAIENGKYVLNAANANYSFGSLHKIFLKAFEELKIINRNISSVLLLGLGGGSVVELLRNNFQLDCSITAVEIDEKVISLATKYFNLQHYDRLEVVCADASEYIKRVESLFELMIVDLFIDNKVPSQFESVEFLAVLKKRRKNKSLLLFNTIVSTDNSDTSLIQLKNNIQNVFGIYEVLSILGNEVIVVE
jgi:spermidine synthase